MCIFTVSLPPAEVVPEVAVARIQNHPPVKPRGVKEGLVSEVVLPVEHIGRGELGRYMGQQLTGGGGEGEREETRKVSLKCTKHFLCVSVWLVSVYVVGEGLCGW